MEKEERIIQISAGSGRHAVYLVAVPCGPDLSLTITGGTLAHVGAVALGHGRLPGLDRLQYSAGVSTIMVPDHKDDQVARRAAKLLADHLHANVVVSCGIHVDHATADDLRILQENVEQALQDLLQRLPNKNEPS